MSVELTIDNLKDALNKEPTEIIEYFESLGVVLSDDWQEYYDNWKGDAFKIAGVNNATHLEDAKDLIVKAIKEGSDLKEFKNTLRENLGIRAWHANLVVSQNISNSFNAGRYYQQQFDTEDFPYLRPIVLKDKRTTDGCTWLADQNICFRVNDVKLNLMYSPRHFLCRTMYTQITEKQRERFGLKVMDIADVPEKYWNKKEFRRLPTEPYNPDISKFDKELQEKLK